MKILYVITDLNTGGVPLHLLRLSRAMRSRGESVSVASLSQPGAVGRRLQADGVEVLSCDAAGPWDWRVISRLARFVHDRRPELVHALLFHANLAARVACILAGFPRRRLICEIQTVEIERRWHLWVDGLTQGLCGVEVGNSPSVIEHLVQKAHVRGSRLHLVWGGVDVPSVQRAAHRTRAELGIPDDGPLILWVGRMDPIKGLGELIAAASQIMATRPARLALIGDGPCRWVVERDIAAAGIQDRVHLLGTRDDVPSILPLADVFAFPSHTEGLPNALLEAMSAGCPIVTTDAPGCRDLIEPDVNGLRVPVADVSSLAHAIVRILSDRTLAARLAGTARATAEEKFRLDRCMDDYHRLYTMMAVGQTP